MNKTGEKFVALVKIMERLRGPSGCPWDRKQNFSTLRQYVIEEAYEVVDAIESNDFEKICDELGDLLMQVVFISRLAKEKGKFDINDVIKAITEKMLRRHPHVFGNETAKTPEDVLKKWGRIKRAEGRKFLLHGIPKHLPALLQSYRIGQKASHAGFDWTKKEGVVKKIEEEINELKKAMKKNKGSEIEEELGDVLFSIVNLARWLGMNPEFILRKTNKKFINRFTYMENLLIRQKKEIHEVDLKELDSLWEKAKKKYR
jgi:tetrapyrrole methylase family protein/MazG family protein